MKAKYRKWVFMEDISNIPLITVLSFGADGFKTIGSKTYALYEIVEVRKYDGELEYMD